MKGAGIAVGGGSLFVLGVAAVCLMFPMGERGFPKPDEMPDGAIHGMRQRNQARLSKGGKVPADAPYRAIRERKAMLDKSVALRGGVGSASWTSVGPFNVGGRIRAIALDPVNPNKIWIGAASGGLWRTTNGGTSWQPSNDFMSSSAIGCITYAAPQTLYAGTGEGFWEIPDGSSNTAALRGSGIYRSTDDGVNWTPLPSTQNPDFYAVNRIIVKPDFPNEILAATPTGIYRSTDTGATWTKTLNEYGYDVKRNPFNPNDILAGVHENGAFRSLDGGITWTPSNLSGHRTELAYARSASGTVYASLSTDAGTIEIWKSTNGGTSFVKQAAANITTYEAYNNAIWVNPANANDIVYGGVYLYRSTNGGASRTQIFTGIHPDIHVIVESPTFSNTTNRMLFFGTDGGIARANDYTTTALTNINGQLPITQFYGAAINPVSGRIMGGTQDNYTQTYTGNANGWVVAAGGDGGYAATDPADQNYFYGCVYWALQFRSTSGGTSTSYIYNTANPITDANNSANVNFINHHIIDPNNANRALVATKSLWRSNNVKATSPAWFIIKPELPLMRGPGGGNAHFNPNPARNISTIAVAQGNSDIIWVGHNNGQVFKTTNGTATSPTWTRMDLGMPARWVGRIYISRFNANEVWVAYMGWEPNNLWKTTDGGVTWTQVNGLPAVPISCIQGHPTMSNWLYAGTDLGLFTSSDGGQTWSTNNEGPANVPIEELHWRNNTTLMAVTHGRGIWLATVNAPEDAFSPTNVFVATGISVTGTFGNALTSDDTYLGCSPDYTVARGMNPVVYEAVGTSPISAPTSMKVQFEGRLSAPAASPTYDLKLFNYVSNSWESVQSAPYTNVTGGDVSVTVTVASNASRFVSPTRTVRARIEHTAGATSGRWSATLDMAMFRVSP